MSFIAANTPAPRLVITIIVGYAINSFLRCRCRKAALVFGKSAASLRLAGRHSLHISRHLCQFNIADATIDIAYAYYHTPLRVVSHAGYGALRQATPHIR